MEIYVRDSAHLCLSLISILSNMVLQNESNLQVGCHGIVARTPDSGSVEPGSIPLRGFFHFFADFQISPNFKGLFPVSAYNSKHGTFSTQK